MGNITPDITDHFIQLSGPLFEDVQQSKLFPDSKTFVDSIPKSDTQGILTAYEKAKRSGHFNLKAFVYEHFRIPDTESSGDWESSGSMDEHIDQLWDHLTRQPDTGISDYSTLIPLPYPYIVPGGRFREVYYWDSYFTAEGLAASGRMEDVMNMVRNFAYLVEKIGHVPNGNRYYYISRSQPPFLIQLAQLVAHNKGETAIQDFIPVLEQEYAFWMDGHHSLTKGEAYRRTVRYEEAFLNRYWDDRPLPREESYREDFEIAEDLNSTTTKERCRHLRAGAESGWDFSSRWFRDGNTLSTIHTTEILPVDLNSLLWQMEQTLAQWTGKSAYGEAAEQRQNMINRLLWDENKGYYFDYDRSQHIQTGIWSLAAVYPLFTGMASSGQAAAVASVLEQKFLKGGGLVTTLHDTGQQWDFPNGWAPLQWMAVKGLMNYGFEPLASTIAERWLTLNESVYKRTGRMMEKYNVCDLSLEAGGGEYSLQDGFGWTNGVAKALKKMIRGKTVSK